MFSYVSAIYDCLYRGKRYEDECHELIKFVHESISEMPTMSENLKLLDVGCGTGNHLVNLSGPGIDTYGIDPSSEMIAIANQKCHGLSNPPRFQVSELFEFNDKGFDVVLMMFHVFNYLLVQYPAKLIFEKVAELLLTDARFGPENPNSKKKFFIFDMWNGEKINEFYFEDQYMEFKCNEALWIRKSQYEHDSNLKSVKVKYQFSKNNLKLSSSVNENIHSHSIFESAPLSTNQQNDFEEEHNLRYCLDKDIRDSANQIFEILDSATTMNALPSLHNSRSRVYILSPLRKSSK